MTYILDVFMADTSSLKNRALVFAFSNTPYIATTFIGPRAAQSFLRTSGWPWGFGAFAIITPFTALPIIAILWGNQRKAIREGLLIRQKSGRTFVESVNFYFWEFDSITAYPFRMAIYLPCHSHRPHPHFRGLCPHLAPLLPCLLSGKGLALRPGNIFLRRRRHLLDCLWAL